MPVFGLKAKVAKLVFRKETLSGVEGDISVQGNLLKLNTVKVADLLGAKMDVQGSVTDFGTAPRFDLTFNATMPDADKLIDYAGLPKFINGKIGAASAGGGVVGTMDVIALRNATATLLGGTMRATGALALGQNFRFDFSSFALQTQDASRLLAVATGRAQGGTGAIAANGAFKGDAQRVSFDGNLVAVGTAMTGHIDATLGKRPNITANLRIPGTLDFDHWLGVSAARRPSAPAPVQAAAAAAPGAAAAGAVAVPVAPPRAATGKPIDLSALRAFDATLTLETSAVAIASLKVTYADMQASLKNGVFKIAKLTGQFYGGAVDFNGTIDATKDALTLDLQGSLQGIYLGEMLRGTGGTNTFGNQDLMVSVDGKINVMNIALKGSGTSPEQIRNSLNGSGQVSGYIYPSVTGRFAGPGLLRHRRRQHLQHRDGAGVGGAGGLHQPPEHDHRPARAAGRHGDAAKPHGAGPECGGDDHQPEQHDGGHDRHDDRARHRQARPGGLRGDGEGADLLADHEHARRQQ